MAAFTLRQASSELRTTDTLRGPAAAAGVKYPQLERLTRGLERGIVTGKTN